jgi:hypothetical protein
MNKNHIIYTPALQRPPISRPVPKAAPQPKTSATAIAPLQLYPAVAAIACRISCPVSAALSYGEGAKWTLGTTSFFGHCDILLATIGTAPERILKIHAEANQPMYSPPRRSCSQIGIPSSRCSMSQVPAT